jgi:hypothetical protein
MGRKLLEVKIATDTKEKNSPRMRGFFAFWKWTHANTRNVGGNST